jgi:hypothetical protein
MRKAEFIQAKFGGAEGPQRGARSRKLLLTGLILGSVLMFNCTDDSEGMEASLIGPLANDFGGLFRFTGEIDNTLTTSCGTVSAGSTTASTSTDSGTSSSSSSSSSSENQTEFSINSFYQFRNGESLFLKFTYSTTEESFRLTPTTSSVQTCFTTDFTNCNGSEGNPTCETIDGVSCGGSSTFIFTSIVPVLAFQARTGTIRWDRGFRLNSDQNKVVLADLEFDMVGTDGVSLFQGDVRCLSND